MNTDELELYTDENGLRKIKEFTGIELKGFENLKYNIFDYVANGGISVPDGKYPAKYFQRGIIAASIVVLGDKINADKTPPFKVLSNEGRDFFNKFMEK